MSGPPPPPGPPPKLSGAGKTVIAPPTPAAKSSTKSNSSTRVQPSDPPGQMSLASILAAAPARRRVEACDDGPREVHNSPTPSPSPARTNNTSSPARQHGYQGPPKPKGVPSLTWSISGPQVSAAQAVAEFKMTCRDTSNQVYELDVSTLEARMWEAGDKGSDFMATIKRQNKGVFILQFRPTRRGTYHFNVWVKGGESRPIYDENDPVVLTVTEEEASIIREQLFFATSGPGLVGGEVGHDTYFEISVTGSDKRPREVDSSQINVTMSSQLGGSTILHVERSIPGKYRVEYKPRTAGQHTIATAFAGQTVCTSQVTYDTGTDPAKSVILNAPPSVRVGEQATFVIETKSSTGRRMTRGGETFDCGVAGPENGVRGLVVRDELTGSYTVRFTLATSGSYKFFVSLRDIPLMGSPFTIVAT